MRTKKVSRDLNDSWWYYGQIHLLQCLSPSLTPLLRQWLNAIHLFFSIIKLRCDFITELWLSLRRLELFSRFFCSLACVLFIFSLLSHLIFSLTNVSLAFSDASKSCRPVNQLCATETDFLMYPVIYIYTASSFTQPFNLYTVSITVIFLPVWWWLFSLWITLVCI